MGKTVSPYCLYEEREIINCPEYIIFERARWQSFWNEYERNGELPEAHSKTEEEILLGCTTFSRAGIDDTGTRIKRNSKQNKRKSGDISTRNPDPCMCSRGKGLKGF